MKHFKILCTIALGLLVFGCSSVKVTTDSEKDTDFSKYKTFSFLGWQNDSDQIMNDIDKKRMRDAFKVEFQQRGLELIEEGGDMAISLFIVANLETSVTAYTNYYGGAGRGRYRGYGGGMDSTTYTENTYVKGTLVMDVFDELSATMIWQGVATGTIQEKAEKRETAIPKTVAALMKKFPVNPSK